MASLFPQNDPAQSSLQAIPQGLPLQDPRLFNANPQGMLDAATALGKLPQVSQQLALEKAQRKAEMANVDYRMQVLAQLEENLPLAAAADAAGYGAKAAEAQALAAAAANQETTNRALASRGQPLAVADVTAQAAQNAAATAKADIPFALLPSVKQQEAQANAAARGSFYGASYGAEVPLESKGETGISMLRDSSGAVVPPAFITSETISFEDPNTHAVNAVNVVKNVKTGEILKRELIGQVRLGEGHKSVQQAMAAITGITQTMHMADQLSLSLDKYEKEGKGGFWQAVASNQANRAPDGLMSVFAKIAGAAVQSADTVGLVGEIQTLKNTLAHELFGSALSKEESANLQGMVPTVEDISDPVRARQKLEKLKEQLELKMKPYVDRGAVKASGLEGTRIIRPNVAPTSASPGPSQIPAGSRGYLNGVPVQRVIVNGVPGWAPIAPAAAK